MIFRLKHRWTTALAAALLLACVTWLLGGWNLLLHPTWPLADQALIALACASFSILLDGLLHGLFTLLFGAPYLSRFRAHGLSVLGPMGWPEFLSGGLLASIGEEPLFRGLLLPFLLSLGLPPWLSVLLTSFLFAGCHWLQLSYWPFFLWAALEGLLFSLLYLHFDSLLIPLLSHGLHDLLGYRLFRTLMSPPPPLNTP